MLLTLDHLDLDLVSQDAPDASVRDKNHPAKVQVRHKLNEFQGQYIAALEAGQLTPSKYSYKHHFSDIHSEFGCALYGREMTLEKGAIVIGKIHKHPVMNVLLKGKLAVVSENGRRVIEAPCAYMSEPGVKRVGYVLEDCIWLNVLMTKTPGEEHLTETEAAHTTDSYAELGLIDSVSQATAIVAEII